MTDEQVRDLLYIVELMIQCQIEYSMSSDYVDDSCEISLCTRDFIQKYCK